MKLAVYMLFVETGCTSKLLQGEMCQSSIDKMTRLIMKSMSWLSTYLSLVYIYYSCRNVSGTSCSCRTSVTLILQAFLVKMSYGVFGDVPFLIMMP